jgi:hypothetical protein
MSGVFLVAVVEVEKENRIVCQAPGCGRAVYRRIHIALADDAFTLLGSDCFERLYGADGQVHMPYYDWGPGRRLTDEERAQLTQNTAEFIERLELERTRHLANAVKVETVAVVPRPVASMPTPFTGGASHYYYNVHDPSSFPYEGAAALNWKWSTDRPATARLVRASLEEATLSQEARIVLQFFEKTSSKTPYYFALHVELERYLPKSTILRILHKYGVIEATKESSTI